MSDVIFVIGGEPLPVRSLRFGALKRASASIVGFLEASASIVKAVADKDGAAILDADEKLTRDAFGIIAAAVYFDHPEVTAAQIEYDIFPDEIRPFVDQTVVLLRISGVLKSIEKGASDTGEAERGKPRTKRSAKSVSTT